MSDDAPLAPLTHASLRAVAHGFFGRRGGVSTGLYDGLNCGLGSRDEHSAVVENRSRVARHFGEVPAQLLTCHQIHSAEAVIVDATWAAGTRPRADALVTATPGLLLGALAADCMPILFSDAEAGVVGAAHAGWKGALAGVEASTIAAMVALGARRQRITAVIGPCISQSSYEVGPEFVESFLTVDPSASPYFTIPAQGVKPHFDLPGFMLRQLERQAVASAHWVGVCTYSSPDHYYSYRRATHRREADYGRQIAVIAPPSR